MTIYDIAKLAGVSASSVSRVINKKPGVNAEARRKIQEILKKTNYSPNAIARGLVNQSSKTIGILVADIRNTHHTAGTYYIERELMQHGYCSLIMNTGEANTDKVNAIETLSRRRVEGVVMMGAVFQTDEVRRAILKSLNDVPVAMVNGWFDIPNVYGVLADEMNGVESCVRYLVRRGRKHIAFVVDRPYNPSNRLKEEGYAHGVMGLKIDKDEWRYQTENSLEGGYEATLQIVREHPEVDGIVYAVDLLAAGGIRALHDKKIAVPGRIAIVGINNSTYSQICAPSITSLDNKRKEASLMAARILIDHINGQSNAHRIILLPELVEREST